MARRIDRGDVLMTAGKLPRALPPSPNPAEASEALAGVRSIAREAGSDSTVLLRRRGRRHVSRRRARAKRRRPLVPFAILLTVVVLAGVLGAAGWNYYGEARLVQAKITVQMTAGQADLEQAKSLLAHAASTRDSTEITQARTTTDQALLHFRTARLIADTDPLLRRAAAVPYVYGYLNPRIKAVDGLADMGIAIGSTLLDAADIDALLIKPDAVGGSGGAKMLQVLRDSLPQINKLESDLQQAKHAADAVDVAVLTSSQQTSLTKARETIVSGLAGVQQLKGLIPLLFEIMGANGPRTYLVEQVNPAELRAGGGFIGSYSLIEANGGSIKKVKSGAIDDVDYPRPNKGEKGYVAPPNTMVEFIGDKSWVLGDSNFFPDFPTNAKWGEFFSDKEIHSKVDGVLALDPTAVAYLLDITGPIAVPGYGITVQGKDFAEFLFRYENGANRQAGRKALLGTVADALIEKISSLPATAWPALLGALNKAGQERHFQGYFNNTGAEALMSTYRWANDLNPAGTADWLMETESNFGATKANHFVTRSYDLTLTTQANTLHHHLVVNMTEDLNAPVVPDGANYYRAYARLYVPADATNASVSNLKADQYPNTDLPSGTKLLDGWLQINPQPVTKKGRWTMTFDYDTAWNPDKSGSMSLYWQKQPGTDPDAVKVTFQSGGRTSQAVAKLTTDQLVEIGDGGTSITSAAASAASLPSISF